jgi:hypothetical protein
MREDDLPSSEDELLRALAAMDDPPDEVLGRFDDLRDTFLEAIGRAGRYAPRIVSTEADATFSLAGELLRFAEDRLRRLLPGPGPVIPAAATRSLSEGPGGRGRGHAIAHVSSEDATGRVDVVTVGGASGIDIEVNVRRPDDGREIRPFTVTVTDDRGTVLAGPLEVDRTRQAPRFPQPRSGFYVFEMTWAGGQKTVRVEFV